VKDGEIITTGKPTGFLRTEKQYENFIADFEWMHVNTKEVGNSGFFVWADPLPAVGTPYTRGIEVQVLVNLEKEGYYTSQGDLFSIHGATCKPDRPHPHGWARCLPSERRCKGGGEWNHYVVIARDGVLKLHVNGKEVSGLSECKPCKGYLALESEGAECHFRNLKIKELPSSHPRPEETAETALAFKNLFTGLDLSGWKADETARQHWQPRDWVLHYDGKGESNRAGLRTEKEYGDREIIVDFRFPARKEGKPAPCEFLLGAGKDGPVRLSISPEGTVDVVMPAAKDGPIQDTTTGKALALGKWHRLHATWQGKSLKATINRAPVVETDRVLLSPAGPIGLRPEGEMDFGNLFVRELGK
jgi:hypothetical protein